MISNYVHTDMTVGFVDDMLEVMEDVGQFPICVNASTSNYEGDFELTLTYESNTAQGRN